MPQHTISKVQVWDPVEEEEINPDEEFDLSNISFDDEEEDDDELDDEEGDYDDDYDDEDY